MAQYRVEVDGETVWSGEGDDYKVIPEQYRNRPVQGVGDPYPSPHVLFESTTEDGEQIFAVQVSEYHELAIELGPDVDGSNWDNAWDPEDARREWVALNEGAYAARDAREGN